MKTIFLSIILLLVSCSLIFAEDITATKTVKTFFDKLKVKPKHEIEKGRARARFRVTELKRAAKAHIEPWS